MIEEAILIHYQFEYQMAPISVVNISKPYEKDFMDTMNLFMAIPHSINSLPIGRYGNFRSIHIETFFKNEKSDWFVFNYSIINEHITGKRKAIAIYPSYISGLGHNILMIAYFLSTCTGEYKLDFLS